MLEKIIEYIKQKYNPLSIILYGSYANGTNDLNSDFDALVISYDHDDSTTHLLLTTFSWMFSCILLLILMKNLIAVISSKFLTESLLWITRNVEKHSK